jgi:hypothetical protein
MRVVSSVAARATQLAATRTYTHSSAFASIRELAQWVTIAIYQEACCNLQLQHAAPGQPTQTSVLITRSSKRTPRLTNTNFLAMETDCRHRPPHTLRLHLRTTMPVNTYIIVHRPQLLTPFLAASVTVEQHTATHPAALS